MQNNEIAKGMGERVVYGVVIFATTHLVEKGYITAEMAAYVAGGAVTFVGGAYAWWNNRPGRLMDRAASQIPEASKLVIITEQDASRQDKDAAHDLAAASGPKVVAKIQP